MTDFVTTLAHLKALAPVALIGAAVAAPLCTLPGAPAAEFVGVPHESLAKGLERGEMAPLDPTPLFAKDGCGFLRHALLTGGADYDQPQWNLTTLMATWLDNGNGLAHKLGDHHAGYDRSRTEDLWARKRMERASRGLGWPSCGAVQAAGSRACAGCPHFGKIKSPLNLTKPRVLAPVVGQPTGNAGPLIGLTAAVTTAATGVVIPLPYGFTLDNAGFICKETPATATQPGETVRVFSCIISAPFASLKDGTDRLHFVATVDLGHTVEVAIPMEVAQAGGVPLFALLGAKRVKINHAGKKYVEEFLMAWITKLHEAQASTVTHPFGWWTSDDPSLPKTAGDRHGFVYGGKNYRDDGSVHQSGLGDLRLRETFNPTGSIDPWLKACKMIVDQQRPELDVLIACAFAAPLMIMTGKDSVLISGWGHTGCGKTTAAEVGMAVWGHLKRSKMVAKCTPKSVLEKMGQTKNLPLYWDEIGISDGSLDSMFDTYFDSTHGIGMSRLNSKIELNVRGEWQTNMIATANTSFVDFVVSKLKTSGGGMYRVFEYKILHRNEVFGVDATGTTKAPGMLNQLEAARVITELGNNYGVMGLRYAQMLGRNASRVDAFVCKVINEFDVLVNGNQDERYWLAACGTILAGAELANALGACFNLDTMREFLKQVYFKNRERLKAEAVEGGTEEHTMETMSGFFKQYLNETLWTDSFPVGRGQPGPVSFIAGPPANYPHPIQIQWAVGSRMLRICRREFLKYLHSNKIPSRIVFDGLKERFGMEVHKAKIAAGTSYQSIQEQLMCIPIPPGSPFEDQMHAHSIRTPAQMAAEVTPHVETGLGAAIDQAAKDLALVQKQTP